MIFLLAVLCVTLLSMSKAYDEPPVAGQVAIVTGSGQGIGRSIALRLARNGMKIVVSDLNLETAQRVVDELYAAGGEALAIACDVTSEADRQRLLTTTRAAFGRLDVLVNNAGILIASAPLEVSEAHWDAMMNVNTKSVWFLSQASLQIMLEQKRGRIVNIASAAGKTASTLYHPVYNVAKAGVIAMTKTMALAVAPHGIRVNCVCPGIIDTAMGEQVANEFARLSGKTPQQILAEREARVPMGMAGTPQEVADVVSFLVGPDSRFMTGQAINVTGGMVMY
jgi:NAD(P)-dependent dehydrogenase (short-subunit alcohol dehydrogenase family)